MANALICFLKYPEPGHVKTRLAAELGADAAAELYRAMAERVITEAYPVEGQYDFFLAVDPSHELEAYSQWLGASWPFWEQDGVDLGERMERAVQEAVDRGYDKILLIGTDCIGMDETFYSEAFAALDTCEIIIGPSEDGGYYLIGLRNEEPWLFQNMTWSTEDVYEETTTRIEARDIPYKELEKKLDVDTLDDLKKLRETLPEEHFLVKKIDYLILQRLAAPESLLEED